MSEELIKKNIVFTFFFLNKKKAFLVLKGNFCFYFPSVKMSKMTNLYFYFGLIFIFSTADAHLNLYLNQQEVMRLLGKFI